MALKRVTPDEIAADLDQLMGDETEIAITMLPRHFYAMACAVQLAVRHPGFVGPLPQLAVDGADRVFERLVTTEPMQRLVAQGWDTSLDHPIEEPEPRDG